MSPEAMNGYGRHENVEFADAGIAKRPDEYTDRFLVLLAPDSQEQGMSALRSAAGIASPERIRSREAQHAMEALGRNGTVLFEELGIGVVEAAPDQRQALMTAARGSSAVVAMERERMVYASQLTTTAAETATADYLRGYQDGVEELVGHALERLDTATMREARAAAVFDETQATWGLQATRVTESAFTGQGVRISVLDTGVDMDHPDLAGRFGAKPLSLVQGQSAEDGHGHGTHCIGTACGPRTPQSLPRYGVACDAEIYAGKVLSNEGSGTDAQILAGISWAFGAGCRVISMSLGAPVRPGEKHSVVFEHLARQLMQSGTLIVAAAGNDSRRPGRTEPVSHPANCPSILAVAALDRNLEPAFFSNAGINPEGGQIDIAAPGVDVLSVWPHPPGHERLKGTSMATPHVAGVIGLLAQANPEASAAELKSLLLAQARRLPVPAVDVGAGLLQAP
ncbi:MAG TPA: S8 family serine peptidase [Streptomyces sp.]|uniref:S8 family serine peptidase n=1 Tax=Streptomyces sp. TaxID=1931 RepID=UPI002D6CCB82|nr:S8 family serine peptidase [Streptomyces sp.]HZG05113.1 S8 family serine peptidase [Streptomyces sp.]